MRRNQTAGTQHRAHSLAYSSYGANGFGSRLRPVATLSGCLSSSSTRGVSASRYSQKVPPTPLLREDILSRGSNMNLIMGQEVSVPDMYSPPSSSARESITLDRPSDVPELKVVGLENLGNTCYLNATIQCLLHNGPFRSAFLLQNIKQRPCSINMTRLMKGAEGRALRDCLNSLKGQVGQRNSHFMGHRQNDSHEYARVLLLLLHEELNKVTNKIYQQLDDVPGESEAEAGKRWYEYHHSRDDSVIYDIFGGQLQSAIECHQGHKSLSFDPFLDLSLTFPSGFSSYDKISLEEMFDSYVNPISLKDYDRFMCGRCRRPVDAKRTVLVRRWPNVLMLQLSRFSESFRKVTCKVQYPEVLVIKPSWTTDLRDGQATPNMRRQYRLVGVVLHSGSTYGGHYRAFVKEGEQWYLCDDSLVYDSTLSHVLSAGTEAYLLFYERIKMTSKC